jgi:hypothetical protein
MDAPQLRKAILPFIAGFVLCGALVLLLTRGAGARTDADLRAAAWSMESVARIDSERSAIIRRLSSELGKSTNLVIAQQSIIDAQQSQLGDQQSIIDGIFAAIKGSGSGLRGKIQAIADAANKLYRFYYPSED